MRAECSTETLTRRFWSKVDKRGPGECWEWTGSVLAHGYGQIGLGSSNVGTHRVAFFLAHGRWPQNHCCHRCDNRRCVNPEHLFEGTALDNMRDKVAKGRASRGSKHGLSKLTEDDVPRIRALAAERVSVSEIARRFGVGRNPIRRIIAGTGWRHVPAA